MRENKLNGFPFKEFEKIGIKAHNLYRYARQGDTEKEILKKAFKLKYGSIEEVNNSFYKYYGLKLMKLSELKLYQKVDYIKIVKKEYYKAGKLFGLSENGLDDNWVDMASKYIVERGH